MFSNKIKRLYKRLLEFENNIKIKRYTRKDLDKVFMESI